MITDPIQAWKAYTASHDEAALRPWLDEDMVFESPILGTPQVGLETSLRYLVAAARILAGPSSHFVGEWRSATGAVLEVEAEIDGVRINLVDIITLNATGDRIVGFKVMLRPFKAIQLIMRLMGDELARPASVGA